MKTTKIFMMMIMGLLMVPAFVHPLAAQPDNKPKLMEPDSGKALIYFVRPDKYGFAVELTVYNKQWPVGSTYAANYIYEMVVPGKYIYTCKAENEEEILLDLKAGETYFVHLKPVSGWIMARCKMELMDKESGIKALNKCKLAKKCAAARSY